MCWCCVEGEEEEAEGEEAEELLRCEVGARNGEGEEVDSSMTVEVIVD